MLKVCIAPGHYEDAGAFGNGINEEDYADVMAERIGHYLRLFKCDVVVIQQTPECPLGRVGEKAVEYKANLFLSLHFNSATKTATGFEAFVAKGDLASKRIAELILSDACTVAEMDYRGVKWDSQSNHKRLEVLRDASKAMPSVLLELGFISNPKDAAKIKDKRWRENVAQQIALTISEWNSE